MFMFDGVELMMDVQFRMTQREDLAVSFNRDLSGSVRHDLARVAGVTRVEPFHLVPVRLRSGHREREVAITGLETDTPPSLHVSTVRAARMISSARPAWPSAASARSACRGRGPGCWSACRSR